MSGVHVFPLLIGSGFRASLPVGLAWAATRLAPRSSAATRHFIWACAIACALFLPIATIATPRWNVAAPAPLARLAPTARSETAPVTIPSVSTMERIRMDATYRPDDRWLGGLTPWTIATWIWMTGAIVFSCYVLIGHFAARRFYRTTRSIQSSWVQEAQQLAKDLGFNRTLRIVESDRVSVPIVLHLWHSIIVMPAAATQWPWIRIRAALLHELAHIKRNDLNMQSLAQLACSVYWFNPLVWFAAHQLRVEREQACDDFVLRYGTSGADYATHLFEIARAGSRSTATSFAIGLAVHTSQLEQRLVAIVNPRTPRHATTIPGRFIVAVPMLFVALAAGAVQVTTRAIEVPLGAIKIPAPAIQVRASAVDLLTGGAQAKMRSVPTVSNAGSNSPPQEFHWAGTMHEHQTVEVYLGRGSIQVLLSRDDTVHVEARTDNPSHSEIQAVSTRNGVKFCNIVTGVRESRNYCEPGQSTSRIQEDQPATQFVIYVPARLHFAGSTKFGDITAEHPGADSDLATINGNIILELAAEDGADFNGNVIEGAIDSDFPLNDNTPTLPTGERPAMNAPRIVHAILGAGGPHLSAMVVNGNIRLIRRLTE
jgi:beta-lactamase regulating signal transducer with metallopeptidase domain